MSNKKNDEVFPIGTDVYSEDYVVNQFVHGVITKLKKPNTEYRYEVTWCDGEKVTYTFEQILEMNNEYKTVMGLW